MIAKALVNEVQGYDGGVTFFKIEAADLMDCLVGESARRVQNLFECAKGFAKKKENKMAIIFVDEIDSLLTKRGPNDGASDRSVKTQFMIGMDGMGTEGYNILVIGATNRADDLDDAISRRMTEYEVPLASKEGRK